MAGAQFTIPLITVIPGQLITASLWNNEFNNISNNFNPAGMDGYSDTDTQMQIQTNPYPGNVTSHATNLGGEIERIRFQISAMLGVTTPDFWYAATPTDLTTIAAAIATLPNYLPLAGGTMTGPIAMGTNKVTGLGTPTAAGDALAFGSGVINGSSSNSGTAGLIQQGTVSTPDLRANAVTPATLGAIVGSGLAGSNGSVISAVVDGSTIDINGSNQIEVKAGGIGPTQVSAGIGLTFSTPHIASTSGGPTQTITISGRGRLAYVTLQVSGSPSSNPWSVVIDGVTKASGSPNLGSSTLNYVTMDGASLSTSFSPLPLDFSSSAVITLGGANTKTINAGYVTA